ncbi:unnamed protein product [Allacma fusca]|uniref:Uncharacterized protein n=1 Tax=Allacma fusca TaxID=39272 RepID=A0A8J2L2E1_9HEXA|nr:unnamed protein product [Allacma fusca]
MSMTCGASPMKSTSLDISEVQLANAQVLASSIDVEICETEKASEFQIPAEMVNLPVIQHHCVALLELIEPINPSEEVTHVGVHAIVEKMSTPRSSSVQPMATIWNISDINMSTNGQLKSLQRQPQFSQSDSISTVNQEPCSNEPVGSRLDEELISCCLIDFQRKTVPQPESQMDLNLYFTQVTKCKNRPAPTNMRIGTNSYNEFSKKLLMDPSDGNYTEDILKNFENLFDHRTLILWNSAEETFNTMYSCLRSYKMMDLEVKLLYGVDSYDAVKFNLDTLLKAIQQLYSSLNIASAVYNFLLSIEPMSEFIILFRDEGRFERYVADPVAQHSICVLIADKEVILKVTLISPGMSIRHNNFAETLFLSITKFHALEKAFPCNRKVELNFFEDFILGSTSLNITSNLRDMLTSALSELSTL